MKSTLIKTQEFDYILPDEKIAQYPLSQRNHSKLLIYKNGKIYHTPFFNIAQEIPSHYLLVFNNTKVIPARLFFQKNSGALIEILLIEPFSPSQYSEIFHTNNSCKWICLIGNAKKWKENTILTKTIPIENKPCQLKAKKITHQHGTYIIEFAWDIPIAFGELLHAFGKIPIPPYLKRESEIIDQERYQTIFSKFEGSVAAPTASLHFTENEFNEFQKRNINTSFLTLHVGIGTFKPITSEFIHEHELHAETFCFSVELLEKIIQHFPRIIAVGTTSLRALESIHQLALHFYFKNELITFIPQWCEYDNITYKITFDAFRKLYNHLIDKQLNSLEIKTQLMIAPGYNVNTIEAIITNFHQPRSSLLALVASIVGTDWKKIYDYALQNNFRFLSYGDSSLLWKNK
ncbi:MAG: S-adenosylmethionine:tRNA ribosyltransferase-isomerase [Bacteroidales bacterium]|nr:S-adenosylmethionine:tRNA ribosyltransferase-isomerase [Bacteroidales bacterium]